MAGRVGNDVVVAAGVGSTEREGRELGAVVIGVEVGSVVGARVSAGSSPSSF